MLHYWRNGISAAGLVERSRVGVASAPGVSGSCDGSAALLLRHGIALARVARWLGCLGLSPEALVHIVVPRGVRRALGAADNGLACCAGNLPLRAKWADSAARRAGCNDDGVNNRNFWRSAFVR